MKKKFAIYAVLALFIAVSTSCDNDNNPYVRIADRAIFEKQRALWEESWNNHSRSLSGESWNYVNYQFTYTFFSGSSGPVGPVTVTVREGEDSIIENNPDDHRPFPPVLFESMEDVFDSLSRTFDSLEDIETNFPYVHRVIFEIEYCEQHHFPKRARLSTIFYKPIVGGPNFHLEITDFKRLD